MRFALTENDDDNEDEDDGKEYGYSNSNDELSNAQRLWAMSMRRKYPIAVDGLQNEIRDLATILVGYFIWIQ